MMQAEGGCGRGEEKSQLTLLFNRSWYFKPTIGNRD